MNKLIDLHRDLREVFTATPLCVIRMLLPKLDGLRGK